MSNFLYFNYLNQILTKLMKECDLCNALNMIQYRLKSINYLTLIFAVKSVGIFFEKKSNLLLEKPKIKIF